MVAGLPPSEILFNSSMICAYTSGVGSAGMPLPHRIDGTQLIYAGVVVCKSPAYTPTDNERASCILGMGHSLPVTTTSVYVPQYTNRTVLVSYALHSSSKSNTAV